MMKMNISHKKMKTEDNFLTAENAGDPIQELKTKVVIIII